MNNLSNEHLEFIRKKAAGSADYVYRLKAREVESMAREILALREAGKEPVGFRWRHETHRHDNAWSYVTHRTMPDAFESQQVVQYLYTSPQLPAVPDGAERRLAAAVELLKQAEPHMLADESLKDPGGALCGKRRSIPDPLTIEGATEKLTVEYSLSNTGVTGFRDGWNACLSAMASGNKLK